MPQSSWAVGHVLLMHAMYAHKLRAYQVARDLGLRVTVVGPELPAWAVPYVDGYVEGSTDTAAAMRDTIDALRERHVSDAFDGVVTFWDHGVVPAAEVAAALGLPGPSVAAAHRARNKAAMRAALAAGDVPHPAFARTTAWADVAAASERIGFPAIYKPTGGAGSAGVFRIDTADELRATFDRAAATVNPDTDSFFAYYPDEFVLEEYVEGTEVSVEGVVARGRCHVAGVTEKWIDPATFAETQHAYPARLSGAEREEAIRLAVAAVGALELDDCGFHVEVMLTAKGGRVIEVNGRLGGDFIASHLVPLGSGVDLLRAAFDTALGREVDLGEARPGGSCVRFVVADRAGVVEGWDGVDDARSAPGVVELGFNKAAGDRVALPPESFWDHRLGFVVTQGGDTDEAVRAADDAAALLRCRVA
jgi:biotin carboxylase